MVRSNTNNQLQRDSVNYIYFSLSKQCIVSGRNARHAHVFALPLRPVDVKVLKAVTAVNLKTSSAIEIVGPNILL